MTLHNFHFLINEKLKTKLNNVIELNKYSYSGKICFILDKLNNISLILNYLNINEKTKVEYLINKKNIHIFLKKELYEKLKYYHGKCNTYSIAFLVRTILRIFLKMNKKYGFKRTIKKLNENNKILKKIVKKKNKKLITVQLLNFLGLKSKKYFKIEEILLKLLL